MWLPANPATCLATVSSFSSSAPRRAPWPMRSAEYPAMATGNAEGRQRQQGQLGEQLHGELPPSGQPFCAAAARIGRVGVGEGVVEPPGAADGVSGHDRHGAGTGWGIAVDAIRPSMNRAKKVRARSVIGDEGDGGGAGAKVVADDRDGVPPAATPVPGMTCRTTGAAMSMNLPGLVWRHRSGRSPAPGRGHGCW